MFDFFEYSFMVRALIAGLLIAVSVPVLGSFLVARRYSLIADSLAHVSLAGIGAGLLLGAAPIAMAIPVTVAGALVLEFLRQNKKISGEASLAIVMSGGLALAVVLAGLSQGSRVDFNTFLFGSITTTSLNDVILLAIAAITLIIFVALAYKPLLHAAFDENSAKIAGHNVALLNYAVAAITAIMVVLSLRIVGGLLVSALIVIPVIAASRLAKSFLQTIFLAIAIAALAVVIGLLVSFYAGVAAGGAIVLSALALLMCAFIFKR